MTWCDSKLAGCNTTQVAITEEEERHVTLGKKLAEILKKKLEQSTLTYPGERCRQLSQAQVSKRAGVMAW